MNYSLDFGKLAKYAISNIKANPFNREMIDSWIKMAISNNVHELYNTPDQNEL